MAFLVPPDIFSGRYYPALDWQASRPILHQGFDATDDPAHGVAGPYVANLPTPVIAEPNSPSLASSYADIFYHRFILDETTYNLGNITQDVALDIDVFNAFFEDATVTSITVTEDQGITVVGPATPVTVKSLNSVIVNLFVTLDGASSINAELLIETSLGNIRISILGARSVIIPFIPQKAIQETLRYKTAILKAFEEEQRQSLRSVPRRELSYEAQLTPLESAKLSLLIEGWQTKVVGVPVWQEGETVGALAAGATAIVVDTTTGRFHDGGTIMVYSDAGNETVVAETVDDTALYLQLPLLNSYTSAYIIPIEFGNLLNGATLSPSPQGVTNTSFSVVCQENGEFETIGHSYAEYLGRPVLDEYFVQPVSASTVTVEHSLYDSEIAGYVVDNSEGFSRKKTALSVDVDGKSPRYKLREFLKWCKGSARAFWLPSQEYDLELVNPVQLNDGAMRIKNVGYNSYKTSAHIGFYDPGSKSYNFIKTLAGVDNGDDTESLAFETPADFTSEVGEHRISFVRLVRFTSDSVSIDSDWNRTRITAQTVEVPNG